jgi:hypothetical protein
MYKVINEFDGHKLGDEIELNDRRANSELRSGNVEKVMDQPKKAEKQEVKDKVEKAIYKNKAYKKPARKKK